MTNKQNYHNTLNMCQNCFNTSNSNNDNDHNKHKHKLYNSNKRFIINNNDNRYNDVFFFDDLVVEGSS